MVELDHRGSIPNSLRRFLLDNPNPEVSDFDSSHFHETKKIVKKKLNGIQEGLCVYCEKYLAWDEGHVEHIKPRSEYPQLCFDYFNYAQSCNTGGKNKATCGNNKGRKILPIEPFEGCNQKFILLTNGELSANKSQSCSQKSAANLTISILGLNRPNLVNLRRKAIDRIVEMLEGGQESNINQFLKTEQFRHILGRI